MISPASVDAMLSRYGQPITLRRPTLAADQVTVVNLDVLLTAAVAGYSPQEIIAGGPIVQGDQRVTIGTAEMNAAGWPAPPLKDDKVYTGSQWASVRGEPQSVTVGPDVLFYVLQVRG